MTKDKSKEAGGKARADSQSPSERKSLATKAAHARWSKRDDVATATHEGTWSGIDCAVLKDGRRVLSERTLSAALGHVRSGSDYARRREQEDGAKLPVFVTDSVEPFLSAQARERLSKPIRYRSRGVGVPAWGIQAELLPELCDAFLAAREAGALTTAAGLRRAQHAEKLLRSLAKVGVVAIVDEATGYQLERDKDELRRLLELYISEEYRPWTALFPTEYYRELFRLKNKTVSDFKKRPPYFGKITNDIIYDRLVEGTRERLNQVNPVKPSGSRARRHHQHFTETDGVEHLRQHISNVVFLMKASSSWTAFMRQLDKAAPKPGAGVQLELLDDQEDATEQLS